MGVRSRVASWLSWLPWYRRGARDADLERELRDHLELEAEEQRAAGLSAEEAGYAARRTLGNTLKIQEDVRTAWGLQWLETLVQDVRHGLRMLRKSPGFTTVAVLTLAIGIGANTAVFSIVYSWLFRPLPLKNPEQLVSVWRTRLHTPHQPAFFDLYHDYLIWASKSKSFESLGATIEQSYALTGAGEPEQIHGGLVSWNFLQTIGAIPALGRTFVADDVHAEPTCIISHALWAERFHSERDVVGRPIQLNRKTYRILGVLTADFSVRVLDRPFDTSVWALITEGNKDYAATSPSPVAVIGRLKPSVTAEQAEAELAAMQEQLDKRFADEPEHSGVLVVGLHQDNTRTVRSSLWLLFGAVCVLLLIACVNTASLILGRNSQRSREFAVRVALGCSTRRLLQQLTAEVLAIFAFGGMLGLLIAVYVVQLFTAWSPFGILPPGGISLDRRALAVTALTVCLTALLFGSLPALRALRLRQNDALQLSNCRATAGREQLRSRSLFVASEICLSVVLLISAGLLVSTFVRVGSEPLGFETRDVFVSDVALPNSVYRTTADQERFGENFLANLDKLPEVRAAGLAVSWPFNVNGLTPLETGTVYGLPQDQLPQAATFDVSPGYFEALGIPIIRGRAFRVQDGPNSGRVAVINEEMALRYFNGQDPIGKRIRYRYIDQRTPSEPWLTIVGVVGSTLSVRYNRVDWDRYPAVYTSFFQRPNEPSGDAGAAQTVFLFIQGKVPLTLSLIASAVHGLDPDLPLSSLRTTDEVISNLRAQPRVRATLLGSFGLLTLFVAAIGVAGVMGQMVEQRRRDIGIRVALGALATDIRKLVLRHALKMTAIGVTTGLVGAFVAARLLRSFLFGVSALDPVTFAAVPVLLFGLAFLASFIPARRASRLDPIETLRSE